MTRVQHADRQWALCRSARAQGHSCTSTATKKKFKPPGKHACVVGMTSCLSNGVLSGLFPASGDSTTDYDKVATAVVLASPGLATLILCGVSLASAPPPFSIFDGRRTWTRRVAFAAATLAFAAVGLLSFEAFDRLRCDSEVISDTAGTVLHSTMVDLQYPVLSVWGCVYLFQAVSAAVFRTLPPFCVSSRRRA